MHKNTIDRWVCSEGYYYIILFGSVIKVFATRKYLMKSVKCFKKCGPTNIYKLKNKYVNIVLLRCIS